MINKIKKQRMIAKKNGNKDESVVLGTLLGELDRLEPEIINGIKTIPESKIISTIKKMVDNNKLTGCEVENQYLTPFLPKTLTNDELELAITSIITIVNAESINDMGRVMGKLNKEYGGKYDGKTASEIVRNKLK